jgi:hypothetical protein
MMGKRRFGFGLPGPVGVVVLLVAAVLFASPAWSAPQSSLDRGGLLIVSVSNCIRTW